MPCIFRSGLSHGRDAIREQTEPSMRLRTRLTERFDIEHPIISAPMGMIAGGRLAAAVSNAGALGLIGGGYWGGGWAGGGISAPRKSRLRVGFLSWAAGAGAGIVR